MAAFQATLKREYIAPPEFLGVGLDDLSSSGTYTDTKKAVFTVIITTAAAPDIFKWQKDDGAFTTGVAITGANQTLSDGVQIKFAATTGHTVNEQWTVEAIAPQIDAKLSADGKELSFRDHSNYLTNTDAQHALTDFKNYRRLYITPLNGTEVDINSITAILPASNGTTANSNVIKYTIPKDDVYELRLVTVPTWRAGTYTLNMCVWLTSVFYKVNVASTTQQPGGTEWDVITEATLATAYFEKSTIATNYNFNKLKDKE